jgi:hypothetical protein
MRRENPDNFLPPIKFHEFAFESLVVRLGGADNRWFMNDTEPAP